MKTVEVGGFGKEVRIFSSGGSLLSDVYISTGAMTMCMTSDEADALSDALKEMAAEARAERAQRVAA